MATRLVLQFADAGGTTRTFNYGHAKSTLQSSTVKTLMDTMITNGSIFTYPPVTKRTAKLVVTTETNIAVDE